ncbi:MAG: hypothetical protein HKN33_12585 [Pyrinomonadaceae bacterium]|nr:hypothetical protein [Pyrinomonadaceae bacterium]
MKKSGIYHFRVAIYDSETGKAGAAAKFLETPKFEKQRLWISNLTLNEIPTKKQKETLNKSSLYSNTTNRKFALPTYLSYRSVIYNAKKSGEGQTDVEVQTRLILDNRIVRETPFVKLTTADQKDPNRIDLAGAIRLDKDLAPGNYIFQLIVRDGLTKKKFQIATQWVDFELTR